MDGILIIKKEKGYTSNDVVQKVKRLLGEKVGHTGTLDPLATGVLPLLIGKGTKCSKYLINHDKEYTVCLQLGEKTSTGDSEGEFVQKCKILNLDECIVKEKLESFIGKMQQIPPIYSAIKVNGKKLYEYAREGKSVELKPRNIEIYDIELISYDINNKQINFKVKCSKGTYIRSLCEDIAESLGTLGYMKELERNQVGCFKIKDAITISELESGLENVNFIENHIFGFEKIFENYSKVNIENNKLDAFLNGVKLNCKFPEGVYRIYCNDKFLGTGVINNNFLKRDIII